MTVGATDEGRAPPLGGTDLQLRVASAVVLAVIALAGAWFGGWLAALVIVGSTVLVHLEWIGLTADRQREGVLFTGGLVAALVIAAAGYRAVGLGAAFVLIAAAYISTRKVWRPLGVFYAATLGFGLLFLRLAPGSGLSALMFALLVVWATDTGAFFAGRLIGGAKLWPEVSPRKTWAGALGGLVAGTAVGVIVAAVAGHPVNAAIVAVGAALSLATHVGDLFESWVKRVFGAKDSGHLVPGHGGFMDRVDGLIFAGGLAALIGWLHGGAYDIAAGLMAW